MMILSERKKNIIIIIIKNKINKIKMWMGAVKNLM